MSSSMEAVSSDTVTRAVAMASASIMTKNNRKNDDGHGLKSKEGSRPRPSTKGRDKDSANNKIGSAIDVTARREETKEEVKKLRCLVKVLQAEREHLQKQCSTFERAGMQVTTHNVELKDTIKSLETTMKSLKASIQGFQQDNQYLSESLMELTTHLNQVVMPKYNWCFRHARLLEFNYGVLLNNHHHLRGFCDSLLQSSHNSDSVKDESRAGPVPGAAAQAQETTQKYSSKEPEANTTSKRLHRPFLQPRPSKLVESNNEKNPQNHSSEDLSDAVKPCTKPVDPSLSRRGRPSLQGAKSTNKEDIDSLQEAEKISVDINNSSDKAISSRRTTQLQRPSTSHASSSSAVDAPIAETPKLTGQHTSSAACSMGSRIKVDAASAKAPIAMAVPGTYHPLGRHVTPSPQISYQMMSGTSSGAQQPPLFPHPYLASASTSTSIHNQNNNLVEQRNAAQNESHVVRGVQGYAPHPFYHPPPTFHGAANQINSNQSQNYTAGQKRGIARSGRGGAHCVPSKKKKPCADV